MIRKKCMLIFKTFFVVTVLCLAVPSAADVKNCIWCEKEDAKAFMTCVTRRMSFNSNFKDSIASLIEMKTTLLEAADAMKMKGPTKDNAMKGALTYALSELIGTKNYDQAIRDVIKILTRCYQVIHKKPDQIFLDEFAKTVKIILEENEKSSNAQQPLYQTKPDEISKIGKNDNYLLQDNAAPQQVPEDIFVDANPNQKPSQNGNNRQNQQSVLAAAAAANNLYSDPDNKPLNGFLYKEEPTGQNILQQPNFNQGSANPFVFSAADSYAATYQPIPTKQQPDSPNKAFLLNAQPIAPLNPSNTYNQQYNSQGNKNAYQLTYPGYPSNDANNKNYPQQSVILNNGQNSQSYGKNSDYYPQNQNPNVENAQYLKDKYPENQPAWSSTGANADSSVYTYNGPQNNNGYYLPYSGSSGLAASQATYYGSQNSYAYNSNNADFSAVAVSSVSSPLEKDKGNNAAAAVSYSIDKYPDNNQQEFGYPPDKSNLKFLPKASDKLNKNKNPNLFVPKSKPQSNTNQKDILGGKDDKTAKSLKFSQTLFIILKEAIPFKKVYNEITSKDQVIAITPFILYDALYTCSYPENIARTLADTSISFMKAFPEGSLTPSYAEAFCKMIMVLFNSNDLIGDDPDTQAKKVGNALLISLKKIENSIQNNNTQPGVALHTKEIKDISVPFAPQKNKDNNSQAEKLPEQKIILVEKPAQNYDDISNTDYNEDDDYSGPKKLLKYKSNKKGIESYPEIGDTLDQYDESEYIGDAKKDNADDYNGGYSSAITDDGYDDGYDDDDNGDDYYYNDDGTDDINPDDYLSLPPKKQNKQPVKQIELNYGNDNNKDIGQLSPEQPIYFDADEQKKSKSLDDNKKNINAAPINDFIQKPDKQIDLIKNDGPVINPDDYLSLPPKKQNKQPAKQIELNYGNDNNKDIGQLSPEKPIYFDADEQKKFKSLDDNKKNINTAPINDFIQKPDKQIDLIKNDAPVSNDLQNLISKKNINIPNKDQSKDRVKILMKWGLDCMKDGKFDYKTYSSVIASLAKLVQDTNPNWGPQKSQTTVLIETIFALTQLLLKSNIKEIKDTLQQPQKITEPVNQVLNNQNKYPNIQQNNPDINYEIPQKNENLQPVVQSESLNQPSVDYLAPIESILYPPQNQNKKIQWGNDYDINRNPYPVIQDSPISQIEPIYTNSAPLQTTSNVPQNQAQSNNWNVESQLWQNNQNSFSSIKNNNANPQQFLQQTPGQIYPNQGSWNLNEQSFSIPQIVNSNVGIPNANNIPNPFNNQGNLPVFQQNGENNPSLIQSGNQGSWTYSQNNANIPSLVQSVNPTITRIPGVPILPNDLNNPDLALSGLPGLIGTQSNSAPVIPNDLGNPNLLQNGLQGNWALPQQSGINIQNSMQQGNQGSQGNSVPLIPNEQSSPNLVQNGQQGNWPLSQQDGFNTQNLMQTGNQGFQGNSAPLITNDQSNPNLLQNGSQGNWAFSQQNGMNSQNLQPRNQDIGGISQIDTSQQNQFPQNSFSSLRNQWNRG